MLRREYSPGAARCSGGLAAATGHSGSCSPRRRPPRRWRRGSTSRPKCPRRGVRSSPLALHVRAGTFKPVSAATLGGHEMHGARRHRLGLPRRPHHERARPRVGLRRVGLRGARRRRRRRLWRLRRRPWRLRRLREPRAVGPVPAARGRRHAPLAPPRAARAARAARASRSSRRCARAPTRRAAGRLDGSTALCIAPGYPFAMCDGIVTNFPAPPVISSVRAARSRFARYVVSHAFGFGFHRSTLQPSRSDLVLNTPCPSQLDSQGTPVKLILMHAHACMHACIPARRGR